MPRHPLLFLACCLIAIPATAATITLSLDNVPEVACDQTFTEAEHTLHFTTTTAEDILPGYCLFIEDADNFGYQGVYIYPARLVLDLTNVEGVESIEVDVWETHFAGSTRAFVYSDGTLIASDSSHGEDFQTLVLDLVGQTPTSFAISAQESYVWEIRLIGTDITPTGGVSFSDVKALYR